MAKSKKIKPTKSTDIMWNDINLLFSSNLTLSIVLNSSMKMHYGANVVVIYNFFLLTIDTKINQFIKVYHNFYKFQQFYKKINQYISISVIFRKKLKFYVKYDNI